MVAGGSSCGRGIWLFLVGGVVLVHPVDPVEARGRSRLGVSVGSVGCRSRCSGGMWMGMGMAWWAVGASNPRRIFFLAILGFTGMDFFFTEQEMYSENCCLFVARGL